MSGASCAHNRCRRRLAQRADFVVDGLIGRVSVLTGLLVLRDVSRGDVRQQERGELLRQVGDIGFFDYVGLGGPTGFSLGQIVLSGLPKEYGLLPPPDAVDVFLNLAVALTLNSCRKLSIWGPGRFPVAATGDLEFEIPIRATGTFEQHVWFLSLPR